MSAKQRFFLDTNIFVYSFDRNDQGKQLVAQQLIERALVTHRGVISYQVVQEFLNVALRKFSIPLSFEDASCYLDSVLSPLCQLMPTMGLYEQALAIAYQSGYGLYDALIVSSALSSGCSVLYSEDLQDGRVIAGLIIRNPFR